MFLEPIGGLPWSLLWVIKNGSRGLAAGCLLHPLKADIGRTFAEVRLVPIVLQKSFCRRRQKF